MGMAERNAAVGYVAIKKQTDPLTPVTPTVYAPYYSQSLQTKINPQEDMPVYGSRFARYQTLPGIRGFSGSLNVMAEPNTAAYWFDMLATKTSTSGAGPYTHVFGVSNTTDPNSYTLDISKGSRVDRYWGVGASKLAIGWDDEKMTFDIDVSALGCFDTREIASVSTTTIVFKDPLGYYNGNPTKGLVASDLIRVMKADGSSSLDTTVASITDGLTIVAGASAAAFSAGDVVVLRPASTSLTIQTPFLWGRTEFRLAADATTALSAAQTRLESDTKLSISNKFDEEEGSKRSGSFDPASLIRTVYDAEFSLKKYFDTPDDAKYWKSLTKRSLVMRSFVGTSYELRVTFNNLVARTNDSPTESDNTEYLEVDYAVNYDSTDGKALEVSVIGNIATI